MAMPSDRSVVHGPGACQTLQTGVFHAGFAGPATRIARAVAEYSGDGALNESMHCMVQRKCCCLLMAQAPHKFVSRPGTALTLKKVD